MAEDTCAAAQGSWLHLLIKELPSKERLVLFQTCRPLAKHVVHNAPNVRLRFVHSKRTEPAALVEARCRVISGLLAGCPSIHLVVCTDKSLPLPHEIMCSITQITLEHAAYNEERQYGSASTNFDWGSLTAMRVPTIKHRVHELDISRLSDAVEAGQLPALHSVTWLLAPVELQRHEETAMRQFAGTLGRQVTHITTNNNHMLLYLDRFLVLQSITVSGLLIKEAMQQLCDHPTLRSVTFKSTLACLSSNKFGMEGDYSRCTCDWKNVTFHCMDPEVMLALPLAGVGNITISHAISLNYNNEALQSILDRYEGNLVCVPDVFQGGHAFCLRACSKQEVRLLRYLKGVSTLYIALPPNFMESLSKLFQALPQSVRCIAIRNCFHAPDLALLWHGLPQHVTHVQYAGLGLTSNGLLRLLVTAATHVRKLTLGFVGDVQRGVLGMYYDFALGAAPSHLSVQLKEWR